MTLPVTVKIAQVNSWILRAPQWAMTEQIYVFTSMEAEDEGWDPVKEA